MSIPSPQRLKVDFSYGGGPREVGLSVQDVESLGFDGIWIPENRHDGFVKCTAAVCATSRVQIGTGIAVAFARSPMNVAMMANDLQLLSEGRFLLGLGSQIKAHVTRRFSMPWSSAASRMREYVMAMRAIWKSWDEGGRLDFQGDFYQHTLMPPALSPGPNPFGTPPVYLGGVGAVMTQVAGEVADGFLCHGFSTPRYFREVTAPALARGRALSGKSLDGLEVSGAPFVVTGETQEAMDAAIQTTKEKLAFYASTPSYRPVLDVHGWGEVQVELTALSKTGRWSEMAALIEDDMLRTFAVVAEPDKVAVRVMERYAEDFSRMHLYLMSPLAQETVWRIVDELRE